MTSLERTVKRLSSATIREAGKPRRIAVILRAPGLLGVRAEGCRKEYQLPLEAIFTMAVRAHVAAEKRDRAKARAERRAGRS